jgi:hypothetical protein
VAVVECTAIKAAITPSVAPLVNKTLLSPVGDGLRKPRIAGSEKLSAVVGTALADAARRQPAADP